MGEKLSRSVTYLTANFELKFKCSGLSSLIKIIVRILLKCQTLNLKINLSVSYLTSNFGLNFKEVSLTKMLATYVSVNPEILK